MKPALYFSAISSGRSNNFDALRLALAVTVIASHAYALLGQYDNEPIVHLSGGQLDGGIAAVDWFFAISGYLITLSWLNCSGLLDFLRRRAFRIYPGFIAALLICALVVGPLAADHVSTYFRQRDVLQFVYRPLMFRHIYSIQHIFSRNPIKGVPNASLWTIRFELMCYLLVAALGLVGLLRRPLAVLAVFLFSFGAYLFWTGTVVCFGIYLFKNGTLQLPYIDELEHLPRLVTYFLSGSVFFLFRDRIPVSPWLAAISALAVAAACFGGMNVIFPIFGTYLLFWLAFHPNLPLHNAAKYGDFSYGTYLFAYPVGQLLVYWFPTAWSPFTLFLACSAGTLPLAVGSWYCIERPFLRKKKKTASAPAAVPVPVPA